MRATIELQRMIAYTLDDGVFGINAQFASMTFEGKDRQPPDVTAVLNEADHDTYLVEDPVTGWPIVMVEEEERGTTLDPQALISYRDGICYVAISYGRKSTSAEAWRDSKFTNEAITRSIEHGLLAQDRIETAGLRNGIQLQQAIQQITSPRVERQLGIGVLMNPVIYALQFRDNNP